MKANRIVYGDTLIELAQENPNLVVLDADVAKSTGTIQFMEAFPDRFVNVGIAEQNMVGMAAGLATCGKIAFLATFGVFTSMRAVEQIRNAVCYTNLNVKIAGTHGGLDAGQDGATHQAVEDMAIIRSLPNMRLLVPSTANATKKLTRLAADLEGPVYLRFGKEGSEEIYSETEEFPLGGSKELCDGEAATIIACGNMVEVALEAAKLLEAQGILIRVVDMYSLKPLDESAILRAAQQTRAIVTMEDHSIIGGLGGAVCEVLAGKTLVPIVRIGLKDCFGRSGTIAGLHELFGLTPQAAVDAVLSLHIS
jgi:transketolase